MLSSLTLFLLLVHSQSANATGSLQRSTPTRNQESPRSYDATRSLLAVARRAQSDESLCSCSPTTFNFLLTLDQTCDVNDIDDNPGIEFSYCITENVKEGLRKDEDEVEWIRKVLDEEYKHEEPIRRMLRNLQDAGSSGTPVEIISAQFLEFDNTDDLKVIYQDDTFNNVSLGDGDSLTYYSKSSFLDPETSIEEQIDYVPGGASLIMYGRSENGTLVRNRFFWVYDNSCDESHNPINAGDRIGWVTLGRDLAGPWPAFCTAVPADSPTISPRTLEPTFSPSQHPVEVDDYASFEEEEEVEADSPHMAYPDRKPSKASKSSSKSSKSKSKSSKTADFAGKSGKSNKAKSSKSGKANPALTQHAQAWAEEHSHFYDSYMESQPSSSPTNMSSDNTNSGQNKLNIRPRNPGFDSKSNKLFRGPPS